VKCMNIKALFSIITMAYVVQCSYIKIYARVHPLRGYLLKSASHSQRNGKISINYWWKQLWSWRNVILLGENICRVGLKIRSQLKKFKKKFK
jgi:hypothetical protein